MRARIVKIVHLSFQKWFGQQKILLTFQGDLCIQELSPRGGKKEPHCSVSSVNREACGCDSGVYLS